MKPYFIRPTYFNLMLNYLRFAPSTSHTQAFTINKTLTLVQIPIANERAIDRFNIKLFTVYNIFCV